MIRLYSLPAIVCGSLGMPAASLTAAETLLEEKNPLVKNAPNWITTGDDTRLIRARLGISRTDKQGTLPVYADEERTIPPPRLS